MRKITILILSIFLISGNCYSDELIVDFKEESLPVLNEELRKNNDSIKLIQSQITTINTTIASLDTVPTGTIVMWAGAIASPPTGWIICDGSDVTATYPTLAAICGTKWGTSGRIPNFTSRFPYGANEGASAGQASVGSAGGDTTQAGNDSAVVSTSSGVTNLVTSQVDGSPGTSKYDAHTHSVMPQYLAVAFIIKT
jgi:hypothetical protein